MILPEDMSEDRGRTTEVGGQTAGTIAGARGALARPGLTRGTPQEIRRRRRSRAPRGTLGAFALALGLARGGLGWAGEATAGPAVPAPGEAPWQALTFRSIPTETEYRTDRDEAGRASLAAESRCGASGQILRLEQAVDLDRTPRLAWRWRIDAPLEGEAAKVDERTRAGDDFAARVYVLFPFDPERASIMQRLERAVGEGLYGAEMPGATLSYVWPRAVPAGTAWTSPARSEAILVAIEAPTGDGLAPGWHEAVVDLRRDARERLGLAPGVGPFGVGLMTDADDTCTSARAAYADFRWLGPDIALKAPEGSNASATDPSRRPYDRSSSARTDDAEPGSGLPSRAE